jgi:hypothetical protein
MPSKNVGLDPNRITHPFDDLALATEQQIPMGQNKELSAAENEYQLG